MKKGDKVRLIKTSKLSMEDQNWLEKEESKPKVGDEFTIARVNPDGWLWLKELDFGHPPEKFQLIDPEIWIEPKVVVEGEIETWRPQMPGFPDFWGVYYKNLEGLAVSTGFDFKYAEEAHEAAEKLIDVVKEMR